tara:strand:+ start:417 stop:2621 length:2205 start_codon:yes stop_codon:yes gene_type:complete
MSSTTGIRDGDFDRLNVAFDLGVGLDNDFGTSGKVLTSSGENEPLFWGTNSSTLPEPLREGTNIKIVKTSDGTDLTSFNGSIDATIKTSATITADEIKTDKIVLPKSGVVKCEILSSGNIITDGNITGGNIAGTSLASSTDITATTIISGGNLTTAGSITATGTGAGFVGVGTDADTYKILLEKDGTITCDDLVVDNHTGSIGFNDLRCNEFSIPQSGSYDFILTSNTMTFSNPYIINGGSSTASFKSLVLNGGTPFTDTFVIEGSTDTTTDTAGNLGSITMNTGDLTITTGGLEVVAGNSVFRGGADFIGTNSVDVVDGSGTLQFRTNPTTGDFTAETGDIVSTAGSLTSNRIGSKPAPIDDTYTEFALNLTNTNSHGYIGGNLIVEGNIYGNVEGTITEEHIQGTSITIRTATPSAGTPTGIIMDNGDIELTNNKIKGNSVGFEINGNNGNINCGSFSCGIIANQTITIGANTYATTYNNLASDITMGSNQTNTSYSLQSRLNTIGRLTGGGITGSTNVIRGVSNSITAGGLILASSSAGDIEGSNTLTNTIYNNELKYVNLDGREITQSTFGNVQKSISGGTGGQVIHTIPELNTANRTLISSAWLSITGFGVSDVKIVSTTYRFRGCLTFQRTTSKVGKVYGRVDSANTGGLGLTSSLTLILNYAADFIDTQINFDMIVSGLTLNSNMSFYPRFMIEGAGAAGFLTYGGTFGPVVFDCIPIDSSAVLTPP